MLGEPFPCARYSSECFPYVNFFSSSILIDEETEAQGHMAGKW